MDNSSLLQQQQATVRMLEKLVKVNRASPDQLAAAQRRLADLQNQTTRHGVPAPPRVDQPVAVPVVSVPVERSIGPDEYNSLQTLLSQQADKLQRKIADLSNQLHQIPQNVPCPHLTRPILDLVAQREAVWDKKRYLERNRCMPPEPTDEPDERPAAPQQDDAGRFELAYKKSRLVDQRSKLKRKLGDPKAKPSKRVEWERELAQCERAIQDIEFKLS